jgi:hypothetical protein
MKAHVFAVVVLAALTLAFGLTSGGGCQPVVINVVLPGAYDNRTWEVIAETAPVSIVTPPGPNRELCDLQGGR